MTLIVGILCSDGVVMAADGAATYGAMGQMTMRRPMKKLTILHDSVILGLLGTTGMAQRFAGEISRAWEGKKYQQKQPDQVMREVQAAVRPIILEEMQMAAAAIPVVGHAVAAMSAVSGTLLAMNVLKKPQLFRFDQQASPEAATSDLPLEAVGSGEPIADPFLAFIRRLFWPANLPTTQQGVFAALWAVRHAIQTSPGGVAEPIQVAVLKDGKAKEVPREELQEHDSAIDAAERRCANVLAPAQQQIEPPPQAPAP